METQGIKKIRLKTAGHLSTGISVWTGLFCICLNGFDGWSNIPAGLAAWTGGILCALSGTALLWLAASCLFSWKALVSILLLCLCLNAGINQAVTASGTVTAAAHLGINLSLMGTALAAGMLVASGVKEKTHIIPLAGAAAMADLWSVTRGVTHAVVQSPVATNYLLLTYPVPGYGPQPLIGVADFAFAVLFICLARRFHLPLPLTGTAIAGAFTAAVTLSALTGTPVPVIPLLGAGFVAAHCKRIRPTDPGETRDGLVGLFCIAWVLKFLS